jgi:hypothetical protein
VSSFRQATTLYRQAGGYVDGIWVKSGETPIAITASIQPAPAKDLQNLEQGRRNGSVFAVYTDTEIKVTEQETDTEEGTKADQLEIDSVRYEAVSTERWQNNVIPHWRALFARID